MLYGDAGEGLLEGLALGEGGAVPGLFPQLDGGAARQRLIVVANRLPVSAYKDRGGRWQLQVSAGGLVSALMGVGNFQTKWIGWPGGCVGGGVWGGAGPRGAHAAGFGPAVAPQQTGTVLAQWEGRGRWQGGERPPLTCCALPTLPGVYIEAGPEREELSVALGREGYVPV